MSKIGVMVCGNSGIDYIKHDYDIDVIRSILFVGDNEYTDFVDISAGEFYQMLDDDPDLSPSTAQAATGVILQQYKKMIEKGYDELLVITISKKLSGTYEGCVMAANMIDDVKITVFDSQSAAFPEAKMALDAAKMLNENKKLPIILEHLKYLRDHHNLLFSVKTLKYLVKGGRLSGAAGFFGSMFKIKPMLELTADGRVEVIEKIRTLKKATSRLIEKFIETYPKDGGTIYIVHANAKDRADEIKEEITQRISIKNDIKYYPLTPVVGAHTGPGIVAIGYIKTNE
ncbi:MAG: DegV family protein [Candidatus Izimaplasma sp.]|nr:DegV family protein [Candidatus Izimaplasma bacterium]